MERVRHTKNARCDSKNNEGVKNVRMDEHL